MPVFEIFHLSIFVAVPDDIESDQPGHRIDDIFGRQVSTVMG